MASSYNLTPEKKQRLKKEVLEEINKSERTTKKSPNKKAIPAVRKNPQPAAIKIESKSSIDKLKIDKKELKIDIKKAITTVKPQKTTTNNKTIIAKVVIKKPKTTVKKNVKKISTTKVKIKIDNAPAPSPITKKKTRTPEDKIRERDLFFRPDSSVRPSISSIRIAKPKIKINNFKMFILGAVVFLILGSLITLGVNIFGIYKFGWNGQASQKIISVLPLPAGSVDGRFISLADYYRDLNIVKGVLSLNSDSPAIDSDKTKEQIFNRLVSVNIIENELKKYGQSVTKDQLDMEMQKVIDQVGSEDQAKDDIKNAYGMDLDTFKQNVLMPILAVDILSKIITDDESLDVTKDTLKNADDALALAKQPGTDFKTLVLQYSNDPSTINQNGDLGWFSRGELPAEIENAIFSLNDGEIYNQVVRDDVGYHIYKVESKLIDEESGKESVKLNQILITVNTELYIKSLFDNATIKKYI